MSNATALFMIVPTATAPDILAQANFHTPSLKEEGFIHACEYHQVRYVLEQFYDEKSALSLLIIAPELLQSPVKFEAPSNGDTQQGHFPHIYGPLNTNAIVDICPLAGFTYQEISQQVMGLLQHYKFDRLPVEGTLYKSTWRSEQENEKREPYGTAMIGMYCNVLGSISCFHKLEFEEVWHFYAGSPLELSLLYPNGEVQQVILGNDFSKGQVSQFVVPAGVWQGGCTVEGGTYSLFGCTMAPGFTGNCFTAAKADELVERYPSLQNTIKKLSVNGHATKMPEGFAN